MVITIALFVSVVQVSVSPWSSRCYFLRGQTWLRSRPGVIAQHLEFFARVLNLGGLHNGNDYGKTRVHPA